MTLSNNNNYKVEIYENKTLSEFIDISLEKGKKNLAYKTLYKTYTPKRIFPD